MLIHFFFSFNQGSFSEFAGLLVHCINLSILLTFPAAVVLLVPSMTPGIFFTIIESRQSIVKHNLF